MDSGHKILLEGAEQLGIRLHSSQIDQFFLYKEEMQRWNQRISLTSITDEKEFIVKHFLDSIFWIRWFPPHSFVADIGSGTGLPGIALKIMEPTLRLYLIEAQKKKANFLRHIVRYLNMADVTVLEARFEDEKVQLLLKKSLDRVIARALGPIQRWGEAAIPLLKSEGAIVWTLGRQWHELLGSVEADLRRWGMRLAEYQSYSLPFKKGERGGALLKLL